MRDRRHLDVLPGEVDAIGGKAVDDRPEGAADLGFGHVAKAEIGAARRAAAAGRHLPGDRIGREIARQHITPVAARIAAGVVLLELALLGIEQFAAELVAERVPHDGIHADEAGGQMPDRKELHEFHVDQFGAGAQPERVAVAGHVGGRAVAQIKAGKAAGSDDHRPGGDRDRLAGRNMQGRRATGHAVGHGDIDDQQFADALDAAGAIQSSAQRL